MKTIIFGAIIIAGCAFIAGRMTAPTPSPPPPPAFTVTIEGRPAPPPPKLPPWIPLTSGAQLAETQSEYYFQSLAQPVRVRLLVKAVAAGETMDLWTIDGEPPTRLVLDSAEQKRAEALAGDCPHSGGAENCTKGIAVTLDACHDVASDADRNVPEHIECTGTGLEKSAIDVPAGWTEATRVGAGKPAPMLAYLDGYLGPSEYLCPGRVDDARLSELKKLAAWKTVRHTEIFRSDTLRAARSAGDMDHDQFLGTHGGNTNEGIGAYCREAIEIWQYMK